MQEEIYNHDEDEPDNDTQPGIGLCALITVGILGYILLFLMLWIF